VIRVLVVDDSSFFRTALTGILQEDPELTVVAAAKNGSEAVDLVQKHGPDVVTMDVNMPVLNGYEAVERIMALCPTPIVIVTGSPTKQDKEAVIKALAMGAVDVIPKPDLTRPATAKQAISDLVGKVKLFSTAHVLRHLAGLRKTRVAPPTAKIEPTGRPSVVAIAASTGGPAALAKIFSSLPKDLAASVVVAQHITEGFTATLVQWLGSVCSLEVREGVAGSALEPGTAAIAPSGRHMRVDSNGRIQVLDLPPVRGCKPSGDILLTSVAETFGDRATGIVLTGIGGDGTEGLKAIQNRGGVTIGQDESSCAVFGMPKSAIDAGVVDRVVPLDEIPGEIVRLTGRRNVTDGQ